MNEEEKEILINGYWVKIAEILTNMNKPYDAKILKEKLLRIIKYLDKIIELECKDE